MSRQEIFLYLMSVWLRFVFIWLYKASGFSNIFGYYCERCLLCGEDSSLSFLLFLVNYLNGVCYTHCYSCLLFVYFGCAGSVGIFWRAGSYIFSCGLRYVECRAGTILLRRSVGADSGTVRIFFLSGSVVAGTVRLKWWGG